MSAKERGGPLDAKGAKASCGPGRTDWADGGHSVPTRLAGVALGAGRSLRAALLVAENTDRRKPPKGRLEDRRTIRKEDRANRWRSAPFDHRIAHVLAV